MLDAELSRAAEVHPARFVATARRRPDGRWMLRLLDGDGHPLTSQVLAASSCEQVARLATQQVVFRVAVIAAPASRTASSASATSPTLPESITPPRPIDPPPVAFVAPPPATVEPPVAPPSAPAWPRYAIDLGGGLGAAVVSGRAVYAERFDYTVDDRPEFACPGTVCPSPQLCSAGRCTLACDTGLTSCAAEGGAMVCANTRTDSNHCGACGQRCGSGQRCVNSACVCETGETACGTGSAAFCIDAQTDVRNCGACGNRCATQPNASGATCASAMCRAVCSQGFGDCDSAFGNGCEIDLGRNANHCGGCGMACPMEAGVQRVCVAGRCAATSCRAIHEASPMAPSGLYRIDPDGPGGNASVVVYCDMVTQGGGWTLVGRSRPGGNLLPYCAGTDGGTSFGWRSATGAVTDDSQAYALNAAAVGLRFGEVLFGNYAMGKTWGDRPYRHRVPADFLEAYRTRQLRLGVPEELSAMRCATQLPYGEQNPAGDTGSMFNYMGFTDNADAFHLRDVEGNGFGLSASGWMSCYRNDNCYAGAINRQQGMIMVR